jgi:UDP-N-acetylglucosamine pyrophosphorylase
MDSISSHRSLAVVIMAAGKGTRMKSDLPKVLHPLQGRPMVRYVMDTANALEPERLILIVGYQKQRVIDAVKADDAIIVDQNDPQGTGHAIMQTEGALEGFSGDMMILSGDVPLLPALVLKRFLQAHRDSGAWITLMIANLDDPTGYGRIVRNAGGSVSAIVEEKDADETTRQIKEFNSGIYLIKSDGLFDRLRRIKNDNAKGEYYLTDIVGIAVRDGLQVDAYRVEDAKLILGVNTVEELREAEYILKTRTASYKSRKM